MSAVATRLSRRSAGLLGLALVLLAALVASSCGDDDAAVITDAEDVGMVQPSRLLEEPDSFLRKEVTTRGTITKDIEDRGGPNAFLLDGLLVIAPQLPSVAPVGLRLEVHGTFHRFDFTEPGAAGGDVGDSHPLAGYDGRPALFATRVRQIG